MTRWQDRFLGRRELPLELSEFEISAFFSFDEAERNALAAKSEDKRIAAAIQLGFLRLAGTRLDAVNILPRRLLQHVDGGPDPHKSGGKGGTVAVC